MARRSKQTKRNAAAKKAPKTGPQADAITAKAGPTDTTSNSNSATKPNATVAELPPRKIKRNRPLLMASCVVLIVWFGFLGFLAWERLAP